MKLFVDLCFLQVLISLACIETKSRAGLHKQRIGHFSETVPHEEEQQSYVSIRNVQKVIANETERTGVLETESAPKWKNEQNNSHPLVNNGGKTGKKCIGKSCIWKNTAHFTTRQRHVITRKNNRRTRSVFLARALDMLDHSQPEDSSNSASRTTSNKPFKLHNFTAHLNKADSQVKKIQKPTKDQLGEKRQQELEPLSEMRPRFIFNTAPGEFVEDAKKMKPGAIHISLPDPKPPQFHRMESVFPLHSNHIHMVNNPSNLGQLSITGPLPNQRAPFHSTLQQVDHSPYAVHLHTPPRIEPLISPDNLGEQVTRLGAPIRTEPPSFGMVHPPDIPAEPFPPEMQAPVNMPPMPPPSEMHDIPPVIPKRPFTALNGEGMPPPIGIEPLLPPPLVQRVPVPVPIPSPPKIDHVPYPVPVPVPGHRSIQPVIVPVEVPSPPKIHEYPVPVESPPKIKNVPVPVPVPVPSPPQIKHVPYPVAVPVRGPPEVQKIFYPVAIRQPSQVHHIPYPVYIRYPPQIKKVPYAVPSPPKPYPVPVPSPPRVMINRVPYPVMVAQRIPFPVPIVVQHHHIHENDNSYEESIYTGQCIVNLCRNGGTCSAYMSFYRCHCPKGYKGKHCEEQDMCRPNPCRNFGSCSEVEHDYECTCTKGFIGKNCDKADPCVPSPCDNGATCSSDGTTYSCTCRIGWIGKNCQVESKCLPINPCQNGGTCTESQGAYKCDCTPGWVGLSCEISAPETLTQVSAPATVPCDNCDVPGDILDQRNRLRHQPKSSKKWTVLKRKNKG